MGLCAVGVDIVELGPMGGERHDEDGWHTFLSFGKYYLLVPGAIKAVSVHKIVPKEKKTFLRPGIFVPRHSFRHSLSA